MSYMAVLVLLWPSAITAHPDRMTAFDVYLPRIAVKVLDILADLAVCILGLIMLVLGFGLHTLGSRGFYVSIPLAEPFLDVLPRASGPVSPDHL